jgi:serine phosphatase RsbU (regulator of sigma subunit)
VIGNIAAGYIRTGRIDEAERFLQESFDVKEKTGDRINQATNHLTWALLWRKRGNYAKAIAHLDTAMEIALKNGNEHLQKNICNGYYELYEETGDTSNALKYYKRLHELEKKLLSEEKNRQLKNIQVKHEVDTIQKEKEIYRLKNIDLAFANEEISRQKDLIEEKNKDITDSINYAKQIQRALLANDASFAKYFSDWFLLYRPKDIVSGDFYWAAEEGDQLVFAICDCTGHGVPGAFMSLLNISYLNEAVGERKQLRPDLVMNHVRERIIRALSESSGALGAKDGMDAVIGCYDKKTKLLEFAASNNPLWLLRNEELIEFRPDKMPVGRHDGNEQPFTLQSVQLQEGDTVFLFTDGFADQFGGPKGKKFKYRQLAEQLILLHPFPMQEQQNRLEKIFDEWKGKLEQVDDVLLFGFRP